MSSKSTTVRSRRNSADPSRPERRGGSKPNSTRRGRAGAADLLVRGIEPQLKRQIAASARKSGNSLSDEVKELIKRGLRTPKPKVGLGTLLMSMVDDRDRGDDLVFELHDRPTPPDLG